MPPTRGTRDHAALRDVASSISWPSFTRSLRTRFRPDMRDFAPNRDIEDRTRVLIGSWGCDVLTGGRGTTRSAARTGTTGAPARSSSRGCCAAVPQRRRPPGQGPRGIWRCTVTRCRAAGRFGTGPGTSQAIVVGLVSQLPRRVRRRRLASAGQSRCRVVQPSGTTAFADKIAPGTLRTTPTSSPSRPTSSWTCKSSRWTCSNPSTPSKSLSTASRPG